MNRSHRRLILLAFAFAAVAAAPAAQGAPAPTGGVGYGGTTAQGHLVAITVSANRSKIARIEWAWDAPCVSGPAATPATPTTATFEFWQLGIPIRAAGTWRAAGTSSLTEAGTTSRATNRLVGRRIGGRITGTIRGIVVETDAAGQVISTCTTPAIRFSTAEEGIFAGRTSQFRSPVVLTLNRARTRVLRMQWNWQGRCTPGPSARPDTQPTMSVWPDFLTSIPIRRRGTFGGVYPFGPAHDDAAGITTRWRYRLVGSRTGGLVRGTVTARITETDTATGGLIRTCSSGPITFRAVD